MENKDILNEELNQTNEQPDNTATAAAEEPTNEQETAGNTRDAELAELKDKYLRLYADFENFRRRTAKEKLELVSTANEGLLVSLLPVVDDFERAMQSLEKTSDVAALKEGVSLIFHKLTKTLEAKGLKPMTAKGEPFNADVHESVTQFPAPSDDLKGKVIDEVEKGYYLNDKVIRFAKVVVGS
ncbi:nucleotide exchange factor GrpE [Nibrella saemangeumensis]|uniref:Protein GrpE n=1 Tax=Nibrella saemangeumensis TaxID=1084526 RepID=A0ABP8MQV5_9BACT